MFLRLLRHGLGATSPPRMIGDSGVYEACNVFVQIYACRTGSGILLIDTGLDKRGRALNRLLAPLQAAAQDVTHVLLSHGHPDHVAGCSATPQAEIIAGRGDVDRLRGEERGKKRAERMYRAVFSIPRVTPARVLDAESEFDCAGEPVLAIPMPGDTPGAFAYLVRGLLFVGDSLDYRGGELQPAPRFATDDPAQNIASILRLAERFRESPPLSICTAHGGATPLGRTGELLARLVQRLEDSER